MDESSDGVIDNLNNIELSINEYKDYFKVNDHIKHAIKHNIQSVKKGNKKFYIVNSSHNSYICEGRYKTTEEKDKIKEIQKSFKPDSYNCFGKDKYIKPLVYYNSDNLVDDKEIQDIIIEEEKYEKNKLNIATYWNETTKKLSNVTQFPTINNFEYNKTQFKSYSTFEPSNHISVDFGIFETVDVDIKTDKIRFYPTKENVKYFNFCFDSHDYFYNLAVNHINREFERCKVEFENNLSCCISRCNKPKSIIPKRIFQTCEYHKGKEIKKENKNDLPNCLFCDKPKRIREERTLYTCEDHFESKLKWNMNISNLENILVPAHHSITEKDKFWMLDMSPELGKNAVSMAVDAFNGCCTRLRNGSIKHFKLKLRNQLQYRICGFDKRALHVNSDNVKIFKKTIKLTQKNKKRLDYLIKGDKKDLYAFKVIRSSGNYYLIVPKDNKIIETDKIKNKVISLDPGIRTFQTGFDPSGNVYKFAENEKLDKINKLFHSEDKIRKALTTCKLKSKTKYNLFKKLHKVKLKVKNIIYNVHNQISNFIVKNYDHVILPSFMSSQMLKGTTLNSKSKRWLSALSHFKFREKLTYACLTNKCKIYHVNESYTTKCCGRCGTLNEVGSSKMFNCNNCLLEQDRDIHAARNIYLRRVTMKN